MSNKIPFLSLVILSLLLITTSAALPFTKLNTTINIYFSEDDPVYSFDRKIRHVFQEDQFFVFMFEGDDLLDNDFLKKLSTAASEIKKIEYVRRVFSLSTIEQISATPDGFEIIPLFDPIRDIELSIADKRKKILGDRNAVNYVISKDAKSLAMIVRVDDQLDSMKLSNVRQEIFQVLKKENLEESIGAVSGISEMYDLQFQTTLDTLKTFIPLMSLVSMGLILWLFPKFLIIALSGTVITIASQFPVFLLNILGKDYTMTHTLIPPLMSALSVALLIHYFSKVKHYCLLGNSTRDVAFKARDIIRKPALYTVLTTAAGLATLGLSPVPPIQSFGTTSACGVVLIYFLVVFLLPPIVAKWGSRTPWNRNSSIDRTLNKVTRNTARFAIRRAWLTLLLALITLGIGTYYIPKVKVETDVFRFFSYDHPINVDTRKIEKQLSGVTPLDLYLEGDTVDFFKNPEALQYVIDLQNWLETLPEIDRTTSAATMIEDMNAAFNDGNLAYRTIPNDTNLISQYLFIYDGTDLFELINRDYNKTRIAISLNVHETNKISSVLKKIRDHIEEHTYPGLSTEMAGFGALYVSLSEMVVKTQLYSLGTALGIILFIMFALFRSMKDAFLCMIPNIAPVMLCFTLMGFLGIWLDIGTALIAAICVGIAVDDTIHLYHTYKERLLAGRSHVFSLMRAYQNAGKAIAATTLVLFCEFGIVMLSDFLPVSNFGLLSAFSVLMALVFDLFVLPAVIIVLWKLKIIK